VEVAVVPTTGVPAVAISQEKLLMVRLEVPTAVTEEGRVTVYARPLVPETIKAAEETVPVAGSMILPVCERVGAATPGRTTVPVLPATILPKFIEPVPEVAMVIALTSVPVAVAVCAKDAAENPRTMIARASKFFMLFCLNIL